MAPAYPKVPHKNNNLYYRAPDPIISSGSICVRAFTGLLVSKLWKAFLAEFHSRGKGEAVKKSCRHRGARKKRRSAVTRSACGSCALLLRRTRIRARGRLCLSQLVAEGHAPTLSASLRVCGCFLHVYVFLILSRRRIDRTTWHESSSEEMRTDAHQPLRAQFLILNTWNLKTRIQNSIKGGKKKNKVKLEITVWIIKFLSCTKIGVITVKLLKKRRISTQQKINTVPVVLPSPLRKWFPLAFIFSGLALTTNGWQSKPQRVSSTFKGPKRSYKPCFWFLCCVWFSFFCVCVPIKHLNCLILVIWYQFVDGLHHCGVFVLN